MADAVTESLRQELKDAQPSQLSSKHLLNKQMALPFIPPKFPSPSETDKLIKPSEYLKSINMAPARPSWAGQRILSGHHHHPAAAATPPPPPSAVKAEEQPAEERAKVVPPADEAVPAKHGAFSSTTASSAPPPPPLPAIIEDDVADQTERPAITSLGASQNSTLTPAAASSPSQPLSTISILDLQSVQLRKTDNKLAKSISAPALRPVAVMDAAPVQHDLIAELKATKDISVVGIKKLKVERAKEEVQQEQSQAKEFEKQFSSDNFLEKVFFSF